MISFTIPGIPKGKARPRVVNAGGVSRAYTPKETVEYENLVRLMYQTKAEGKRLPDDAEIVMQITAYYQIPKSATKSKRQKMIEGKIRPKTKPDLDNLMKAVADALNGIAYRDDSQIVECLCKKYYSENPCTYVSIASTDEFSV